MLRLVTTRPNYGGRRWWFLCPLAGRRAMKLHLPPRSRLFESREAYGLVCVLPGERQPEQLIALLTDSMPRASHRLSEARVHVHELKLGPIALPAIARSPNRIVRFVQHLAGALAIRRDRLDHGRNHFGTVHSCSTSVRVFPDRAGTSAVGRQSAGEVRPLWHHLRAGQGLR
jgi:hypothetical protein